MPHDVVDLRSDTVTRPTPEMRRAMAEAEVGDDVFGDDPTVNALQHECAALLGKEAGLFVPTGSMGNQLGLGVLSAPGDAVVCETSAHFLHFEAGGYAAHLGLTARSVVGRSGVIDAPDIEPALHAGDDHHPRTSVVAIENTHNAAGGRVFPIEAARRVASLCRSRGVAVHLDGARLFNAQAATGIPARAWADCADTVTFCFSKGLGAPIGSMVCSSADRIARARRIRKRLGGGMRQVGVVAAAAAVALRTGVDRLAEDHDNAVRLAHGLADLHPAAVDPGAVETNMVWLDLSPFGRTCGPVREALGRDRVVIAGPPDAARIRLVTHRDVDADDVDRALKALAATLQG